MGIHFDEGLQRTQISPKISNLQKEKKKEKKNSRHSTELLDAGDINKHRDRSTKIDYYRLCHERSQRLKSSPENMGSMSGKYCNHFYVA